MTRCPRKQLFWCLDYAWKKNHFRQPKPYKTPKQEFFIDNTPERCYQQCPLITLPFHSLTSKDKDTVAFPITAKPSPNYPGANWVGSLRDVFADTEHQQCPGSIIRHPRSLQRICSRKKRVREFYMGCFVQKKIRKGRAKTIYQS